MIIELVGLPGAGKSTLAEALKAEGARLVPLPSRVRLITDASLFWLSHPRLALALLNSIARALPSGVRYELFINGYLGYAARYQRAQALSRSGAVVVLDQGFFQLLISLQGLPLACTTLFPKPDVLVAVTAPVSLREERMTARGWAPRDQFGSDHRLAWQESAEAALHALLPLLEKSVQIYRYDGAQNPQKGAALLMRQVTPTARVSLFRNLCKSAIALGAYFLAQVARVFSRTPQVVVLMYHAVDHSGWKLAVPPDVFERQMQYLARKRWTVPLAEVVSYVKGERTLSAHAVAVTFDDGYRDLLEVVLPILERYSIPATVFVPSDFSVHTDPSGRARLTEEEVRTLAQSPLITIASHAKTHQKFTELSADEMRSESEESATALLRVVGKRPRFFAYPFGARSKSAEQAVEAAGYEAAFGINEGTVQQGDPLFRLKRVQIDGTMSPLLFRLRLTSAVDWNRRIVDTLRAIMPV